jgi:outer membrane protein assembly factor BamB
MKIKLTLLATSLLFVVMATAQAPTYWRGGTNGIYPDQNLLKTWPATGPQEVWAFEGLGEGHSSPVFALGHIFVSSMIDKTGYITILSLDGKEVKKYAYGEEYYESWPGTRSTPVVVGDWLYIYSGHGVIYAFDAMSGTLRWKKEILKESGAENIKWGVTETLLVDGDKLFCSPGGTEMNVVALNCKDGSLIWKSAALGEASAYCTPILINHNAKKIVVTMMASHIIGLDPESGKMLWNYEQPNQWSVHANTPIYADGYLVCTSGYGKGTVGLKLSADGNSVEKAWFNEKLDNRMGGVVCLNGYVYGSGDKTRAWMCIDLKTGTEKWASSEVANGVVISADGLLFLYSDKGELALAEVNPSAFKLLAKTKVEKGSAQHWAHPVINNGLLYVRHGKALIAYKIK